MTHDHHWDRLLPGFGLRIMKTGRKSYIVRGRLGQEQLTDTLGTTLLIPRVETARQRARKWLLLVQEGQDPRAIRRAKVEQEKIEAEAATNTVAKLADEYLEYSKTKHRASTHQETARLLRRFLALSGLADRPAAAITRRDINAFNNELQDGQPGRIERSNMILALSRAFTWAIKRDRCGVESNPCINIELKKAGSRSRVLSDTEIRTFWSAADQLGYPAGPLLKLLLVLGQRLNEVGRATWSEIDLERKVWELPAERVKNKTAHSVPLSPLAISILASLPRFKDCDFLFTANGDRAFTGYHYAKTVVARAMNDDTWTLHDLRRSMTSHMQQLQVPIWVTESCLNHVAGSRSGVTGIYNRYNYWNERIDAMQRWSAKLEELISA
jgi:integrase